MPYEGALRNPRYVALAPRTRTVTTITPQCREKSLKKQADLPAKRRKYALKSCSLKALLRDRKNGLQNGQTEPLKTG